MSKLLALLTLKPLAGSRSQYTVFIAAALNLLVQLGVLHLSPEEVDTINKFLTILFGYFVAEKVSNSVPK